MKRAWILPLAAMLASPAGAVDGGGAATRPRGQSVAGQDSRERPATPDAGPPAPSEADTSGHDDGRRTLGRFVPNLGRGTVGVFNSDNVVPLFTGAVGAGWATIYDAEVAEDLSDPDNGFGKGFEDGAGPLIVGAAVVGVFVGGRLVEGPRFRAMSYDMLDAFIVNGVYTVLLKTAVGRERPNEEDNKSFPSGHTSTAFALAAVAERHYGWKAGIPAYAVASVVAVSRLQRNKHYLSDVVAGATLGYIVGRTVVRVNGTPLRGRRGTTVTVTPLLGRQTRGVLVAVAF